MSVCRFTQPTHRDASIVWPSLRPIYVACLAAAVDLEVTFPVTSRRCHRLATQIRDVMIEAELGLLTCTPERKVAQMLALLGDTHER